MTTASFDLADLNGRNGFALNGINPVDRSGSSVSGAGDINGDGIDDLIIGALGAYPNGPASGQSYVVFGSDAGFDASLELSSLDGSNGFALNGNAGDVSGISVSGAGDINGDGIDDLIVGAPGIYPNNSGKSYVVFGSNEGFPASLEPSDLDGSNGFAFNGINAGDQSGESVSGVGDINGDGFDDLIVGALGADPNGNRSGQSYVIFGSDGGFPANLEPSDLDGSNGFALNGINADDLSGYSVSGAGDIDGDGIDDLIIGAPGDPNSGKSYVVFGSDAGFDASLELSSLDGNNGFALNGIDAGDLSGSSVSGAGDINNDGIDDLIVGAFFADPNGTNSGQSYVVFGTDGGFPASLELSSLDGSNGFALNGINAYDSSGSSVSGAGDIDGDGIDDLIIGAPGDIAIAGQSYVVFGFDSETINGTSGDDLLIGTPSHDRINGFAGNDTIIGKAGDDTIDGGSDDDLIVGQEGNDNLTGGGNRDKFAMTVGEGTDTVTDFGGVGRGNNPPQAVIDEIDTLQFFGERLTAENMLLTQTGSDLFITFEEVEDTKILLENFQLEDLENLPNGIGNILFDGQQEIQDDFDVFNAEQIRSRVFNPNRVTFLNDLDNTTQGFEDSNDVINGQGGNDILLGRSGDDLLRGNDGDDVLLDGGAGEDRLDGGVGNDGLFGGADADQFVLRAGDGADTIFDFEDGIDSLLLADGLEFEQLGINSSNGDTLISVTDTDELLASLVGVDANDIGAEDFSTLV